MVKFYTSSYSYDYPLATVSLAYFLRYPNPYASHVLSTDVISREFDPVTQRLCTTRLHLKRSRLPRAVLALLPRNILASMRGEGAEDAGPATKESRSYILERSTVDMKEGWMKTESRNLEWTGVLSVVERQDYFAAPAEGSMSSLDMKFAENDKTDVKTTVTLHSTLGQRLRRHRQLQNTSSSDATTPADDDEPKEKVGFFRSWSQGSIQRSIEAIGLSRTSKSQPNAREGLKVVMERLREGGLGAVLEGMRRDREQAPGSHGMFGMLHHRQDRHNSSPDPRVPIED
jgi:4-amino-4-deoxychorismate lyase